ncbi:MAG: molybdenum cofactor biosynthesis protein A [Parcubacteria group bacterium GW2011_GWC2_38_7]|nr:MAG: molybdenum cofactor biosynthesis protein A [Parcubacteria group bacterium GW2011_GWC2_38_7]
MLKMISEFLRRLFYLVPTQPANVQIAITNKCNFSCKMCQRFDLKVRLGDMSVEDFKKVLRNLGTAKNIVLTGWGEPLLHPNLIEMIKLCKVKDCDVRFTSNGNLLTPELGQKLLEVGLNAITFSVDAIKSDDAEFGHPIQEQLTNIRQFAKAVKDQKAKLEIYLQSTYHKNKEQDLYDVVEFGKEIGVNRLRFSRLDVRFQKFERPSFKDEKKLIQNIELRIKNTGIGIDFLPHVASDGLSKLIFKITSPFLHRFGKYCLRTFNDIYINEDGKATPCCALPNLVMGDAKEDTLDAIWNNVNFRRFRCKQNIACGECDVLKIKTFNK